MFVPGGGAPIEEGIVEKVAEAKKVEVKKVTTRLALTSE